MNYDTKRWCVHGQHMQPRDTFRPLPGVLPKREVCEKCWQKIQEGRKNARR